MPGGKRPAHVEQRPHRHQRGNPLRLDHAPGAIRGSLHAGIPLRAAPGPGGYLRGGPVDPAGDPLDQCRDPAPQWIGHGFAKPILSGKSRFLVMHTYVPIATDTKKRGA